MVNSCPVPFCTIKYSILLFTAKEAKAAKTMPAATLMWTHTCQRIHASLCVHFLGDPKGRGPNDILSIFAWSKPATLRPTKGKPTVLRHDGGKSPCRKNERTSMSLSRGTSNFTLSKSEKDSNSFKFLRLHPHKALKDGSTLETPNRTQYHKKKKTKKKNHSW